MIEAKQIRESVAVLMRSPSKYISRLLTGILLSSVDCELGQVALTVYGTLKKVDDALDGERFDVKDPLGYAQDLSSQIATDNFTRENAKLKNAITYLEDKGTPNDDPRANFIESIDSMMFDFNRAKERRVLSEEDLTKYYLNTFNPVNNLLLIGIGSTLRSADVPEFALSQGRIYSVRDTSFDWKQGVINIPSAILISAGLSSESSVEDVLASTLVRRYQSLEIIRGQEEIAKLKEIAKTSGEKTTERVLKLLLKPMEKFSHGYTTTT